MLFAIDIGHNTPPDTGAVGIKKEDYLVVAVADKLIQELIDRGHQAIRILPQSASSVNNSLRQRVQFANKTNADVFVSIHFNAFGRSSAKGSEVFAAPGSVKGTAIASKVLNEIIKLGFVNRGVKNLGFYVLRHTKMPAILVECCFITNQNDMSLFDADKMANAIANGLVTQGVTVKPEVEEKPQKCKIQVTSTTVLKPSAEQSTNIDGQELIPVRQGTVIFGHLLAEEEGHYCIELEEKSNHFRLVNFIYSEHCKITLVDK